MATLCNFMMATPSIPFLPKLVGMYDGSKINTLTKAYQTSSLTGSGTSGASSFTASGAADSSIPPGAVIKLGGDTYTVSSVSTTTVNIVGTLSASYVLAAIQLDRVSIWNDLSGYGFNATQGTPANQMIYVPNFSGSKSVLFNAGSSGGMALPSGIQNLLNIDCTIFVVAKQLSGATERLISFAAGGSTKIDLRFQNGLVGFSHGGTQITQNSTTTNLQIVRGRRTGTGQYIAVNANAESTNANAVDTSAIDSAAIAANGPISTNWLIGFIPEILIYSGSLNTSEINSINYYLNNKWAIF